MNSPPDQITVQWCPKCDRIEKTKRKMCNHGHKPKATVAAIYTLALFEKEPGSSKL